MDNSNILMETTQKLKTKVILFSGVSLFIGLTETLPTKLSLIGLDLTSNPKTLGWFILGITIVLFINFLVVVTLDYIKYFKSNILSIKGKGLTGDTVGLTYKEIGEEHEREEHSQQEKKQGTLAEEAEDIHRKFKALENDFDNRHLNFTNLVEIFFNVALPVVLAVVGLRFLYCFLN
ncbi:hypothetical protein ACFL3P_01100 [Pseudomonadota bacterium]